MHTLEYAYTTLARVRVVVLVNKCPDGKPLHRSRSASQYLRAGLTVHEENHHAEAVQEGSRRGYAHLCLCLCLCLCLRIAVQEPADRREGSREDVRA